MKLVIGYRLTIFRPLSAQSLFLLSPLSLKMSLSKCPPLLHFQQYFSYTMEVSIYRQRKPDAPDTLTKSNYTSTPCHGHKSSEQRLTVLPTEWLLDKWKQINTFYIFVVGDPVIKRGWDPINRCNPAYGMYLPQARALISGVIFIVFFCRVRQV